MAHACVSGYVARERACRLFVPFRVVASLTAPSVVQSVVLGYVRAEASERGRRSCGARRASDRACVWVPRLVCIRERGIYE
ncbi:hypothetical protein BBOMB_1239 [Bifidobacterium bombi DSM 19703]|uniref:Uncharacterized protein n=1 Tax=Bifidobacterium bombi DSM 19703 TaxID=1341695 RepID=A0A086BPH1_9BIFI|nr:hypothetical protein BBOMB_1239 [Bifidobacterium bombi DSM 19703]